MAKHIEPRDIEEHDINSIHVAERMRALDEGAVSALAESFKKIGMLTPIHYRVVDDLIIDGTPNDGVHVLVAGAHRLAAAKRLDWTKIDAIKVSQDSLTAQLWEIDENLVRLELGPAEEAKATAKRKAIYEELFPETKAGQAQALGMNRALEHDVADKLSATFAADTAKHTGKTERHVRRAARRGREIAPDVLDAVNGTAMDKAVELEAIVKFSPDDQRKAVALVKDGSAESLRAAVEIIKPTEQGLPEATISTPAAEVPAGDADEPGAAAPVAPGAVEPAEDECTEDDLEAQYVNNHDNICISCRWLHDVKIPDHFDAQRRAALARELADAIKAIAAFRDRLLADRD